LGLDDNIRGDDDDSRRIPSSGSDGNIKVELDVRTGKVSRARIGLQANRVVT
jgi:hypothetical protein